MAKRKETRPGYTRITLDLPTPLFRRLRAYSEGQRARLGVSEQVVCRTLLDSALTAVGHPPADDDAGKKARS